MDFEIHKTPFTKKSIKLQWWEKKKQQNMKTITM